MTTNEVHTQQGPGFTYYARWIGRCKACKAIVRKEFPIDGPRPSGFFPRDIAPCACGRQTAVEIVTGSRSEKKCGARCVNAVGPACECSCGGANHGRHGA